MTEPESLTLRILREMRAEMATKADLDALSAELRAEMATKSDVDALRAEIATMRVEMATKTDLAMQRKELSEQIVGLRRAVMEYHSVVVGHGILFSDLEARVRRVEQHLNLPPLVAT
ncbi:MAG: hypothetical protein JO288_00210 [Hyphomicrobiales bacterium]|nr:hypothetical protein [Hyphomicrobiales bacterium]